MAGEGTTGEASECEHEFRSLITLLLARSCYRRPLCSLGCLLVNDFYLKSSFPSMLTGKLSDFAGLFAFALFISAMIGRYSLGVHLLLAITFVWWKSSAADPFIQSFNALMPFAIGRTIDYSDLLALLILPFSYEYFHSRLERLPATMVLKQAASYTIVFASVFAFTSTSQVRDRSVLIDDGITTTDSISEIERKVRSNKLVNLISVRQQGEVYADSGNITTGAKTYLFDVSVDEKICDSSTTSLTFSAADNGSFTLVSGGSISFECRAYANESRANLDALDKSHKSQASSMFRRVVTEHLTPLNPQ